MDYCICINSYRIKPVRQKDCSMPFLNHKAWVSCVTVGVILLTFVAPQAAADYGGHLAMIFILLLGIPHGATDHILFRHIKKDYDKGWLSRFFARYFLLMGMLALTWWVLPGLALMIFLAISAYHFGQSQWHHLKTDKNVKYLVYLTWGTSVLAAPLLWNYTETAPIVAQLIGFEISLDASYQSFIPLFIIAIVFLLTITLYAKNVITSRKLIEEWAVLLLLSGLFYTTSLLVGFAVYFVFWHSIDSVKDQITQLRKLHSNYTFKKYLQQVTPFTLIAFGSIGLFAWLSPAPLMSSIWISQFFILISIVTLPHSLLMDSFLEEEARTNTSRESKPLEQKHKIATQQVQAI